MGKGSSNLKRKRGKQWNTKLDRIEQRSRRDPTATFENLGHALDLDLLRTCYHSLDARKAMDMDRITKEQYGKNLEANLQDLLKRIRDGSYYPKPSRVTEIPKVDGGMRTLTISCTEDKIAQEAVRRILEAIYEPHFLNCSYSFWPDRSAHQALAKGSLKEHCRAAVDIDLRKYFNTIPHKALGKTYKRRSKIGVFSILLSSYRIFSLAFSGSN